MLRLPIARVLGVVGICLGVLAGPLVLAQTGATAALHLDVYKSPTCGCCTLWMDHLAESGIRSTPHHPDDLAGLKRKLGVAARYGSCHTAVDAQGYVFEGHVPARYIEQFLAAPPDGAIGLSVPAMPVGSPGMEYQDKFMPYQVLLLDRDGGVSVYAEVKQYTDQFVAGD